MRTPFSDAPIFAARAAAEFAPAPIEVNTSSSIAVRSAAVCWYAFSALKIRSGVGRPVVEGVAMEFPPSFLSASILHAAQPKGIAPIAPLLAYFFTRNQPHRLKPVLLRGS